MGNVAQLDLTSKGGEARVRALLKDVANYHTGIYPQNRLALAIWFQKSPENPEQHMLELFGGIGQGPYLGPPGRIAETRFSLRWQQGSNEPPFVNLRATSVDYFTQLLRDHADQVRPFFDKCEVLYFDKDLLNSQVIEAYRIVTEPPGLIKGWYIPQGEYDELKTIQRMLSAWGHTRPQVGLVKTEESADFEYCRGLLHVEIDQKWLPLSSDGIRPYNYWIDKVAGRPVYFLLEGGALYEVVRFEVKFAPGYSEQFKLLRKTPDDRYPEVYLRAVHSPAKPAA